LLRRRADSRSAPGPQRSDARGLHRAGALPARAERSPRFEAEGGVDGSARGDRFGLGRTSSTGGGLSPGGRVTASARSLIHRASGPLRRIATPLRLGPGALRSGRSASAPPSVRSAPLHLFAKSRVVAMIYRCGLGEELPPGPAREKTLTPGRFGAIV